MDNTYNVDTVSGPSFSIRNRLGRAAWNVVFILLFRISPKPMHAWRSFLLRCFGAKVGNNVHVYPKVRIWAPWNLVLEDQCGIGNEAVLYSQDLIRIGRRAVISQGAHLCAGTHDYNQPGLPLITKPIIVGDFAWVATEAFVHPGVVIGDGCVVGARSVVTKDMPAWMVCAGHPCNPIKERQPVAAFEKALLK
ncbi:putative colanic acid biosynthesis acetyltransferase [Spirosoma sp. KUDC1026]|uniref:putative colanic acid biosynthesis acetyltransferase n=1 Tax=Spirosoma sp. KUDC1026 TaxID=2745947 RepID=UPI00159BD113|nr:putative colanic acid biosynthesis acetyltransferase [Spirosoma sp. KUDC1026]QKZ15875.1 putative colanic acid biosynthesis acetyltransferase [Spirosoma sp. KUDC1026]